MVKNRYVIKGWWRFPLHLIENVASAKGTLNTNDSQFFNLIKTIKLILPDASMPKTDPPPRLPGCPHKPYAMPAIIFIGDDSTRIGDYYPRHCIEAYPIQNQMLEPQGTQWAINDFRLDFNDDAFNIFLTNHQTDDARILIDNMLSALIDQLNRSAKYDKNNTIRFEELINKIRQRQHFACKAWFEKTRWGRENNTGVFPFRQFVYVSRDKRVALLNEDEEITELDYDCGQFQSRYVDDGYWLKSQSEDSGILI